MAVELYVLAFIVASSLATLVSITFVHLRGPR